MNSIASACHIIAIACYAYCLFDRRKDRSNKISLITRYVAILTQFIGIHASQLPLVFTPITLGNALAQFAWLAVLAISIFDHPVNFPRCLRWLCFLALGTSLLALSPILDSWQFTGSNFNFHLLLAMIAYSMFFMSFLQMTEAWLLNRAIAGRMSHAKGNISLLDMEKIVFRNIYWSFAMLTLTMLSGIVSSVNNTRNLDTTATHEIVFASMTWIFCAVLLLGRWRWGWRGIIAMRWFMASSFSLVLNYIIVVVLIEVLLKK